MQIMGFVYNAYTPYVIYTYEGGSKYFRNLNLPHKRDIVQQSATRYSEPTLFWTSLPSDTALRALYQYLWQYFPSVCKCVWRLFKKTE